MMASIHTADRAMRTGANRLVADDLPICHLTQHAVRYALGMSSFGSVVRARRVQLGLRQSQVAAAVGFGTGEALGMIENGSRSMRLDDVVALAGSLRLDPVSLVLEALREWHPRCFAVLYPLLRMHSELHR